MKEHWKKKELVNQQQQQKKTKQINIVRETGDKTGDQSASITTKVTDIR